MTAQPFNAATAIQTVFAPDGTPTAVTRLNAHDLVRTNGYTWFAPESRDVSANTTALFTVPEPVAARASAEELVKEEPVANLDVNEAPLDEIVFAMVGTSDIPKYLESFSTSALRVMAEARYSVKLDARFKKESLIAKIVDLEAEKTSKESTTEE